MIRLVDGMPTRALAFILVVVLVFLQTAGSSVLPEGAADLLGLLVVLGIFVLFVFHLKNQSPGAAPSPVNDAVGRIGWRLPAAVLLLSALAALFASLVYRWSPRADFDVLGVLWILQNGPGVAIVGFFGLLALAALAVLVQNLPSRRE